MTDRVAPCFTKVDEDGFVVIISVVTTDAVLVTTLVHDVLDVGVIPDVADNEDVLEFERDHFERNGTPLEYIPLLDTEWWPFPRKRLRR